MARLEALKEAKIGLDTVVFISALEGNPEFGNLATQIFEMIEEGSSQGFACDLVLAELMVKPLRQGHPEVAEEYAHELPNFPNLSFCPLTRQIVINAAKLRSSSNLRLIDALHLASAVEAGCTIFLTNDTAIKHPDPGLEILMLSDFKS
ncbi:MAG: type II toxin-antitoxin system VapC family toxin [Oscillatoria sp. PMC 1068.18]|nr:type II toxin-antitoxin system VapC family toxin [Oscillatoria sp. PMC 1076.18]MEC4991723.1 type II toxin-antitoxin system VapC family toxin [Oscillatoria sp. PMC 1068.18]